MKTQDRISKVDLFGVGLSVTDYGEAAAAIIEAARERRSYAVSALATHGLMEAVADPELARLINGLDLVAPDGQPVRWAMNALWGADLRERVYGPDLTRRVCADAAAQGMSVYLFGSTADTCKKLAEHLQAAYPGLRIAGVQPDRFRDATDSEDQEDIERINASGASVVLVGRGCPRQERWVARHRGTIMAPMLAVGAAFDYLAGNVSEPPAWVQRAGLQWLFRLGQDPRRLYKRYLVTNTRFTVRFGRELMRQRYLSGPPTHERRFARLGRHPTWWWD
jgi:N-acetylglucosaminyldiphosphoundecaprenol N-acetyl-beta-D-mannosaminyltransferase